jgi:hypothetical protein
MLRIERNHLKMCNSEHISFVNNPNIGLQVVLVQFPQILLSPLPAQF